MGIEQLTKDLETSTKENTTNRASIDDFKKKLEEAKSRGKGGIYEEYDPKSRSSVTKRQSAYKG